jgi:hypothetical protein
LYLVVGYLGGKIAKFGQKKIIGKISVEKANILGGEGVLLGFPASQSGQLVELHRVKGACSDILTRGEAELPANRDTVLRRLRSG